MNVEQNMDNQPIMHICSQLELFVDNALIEGMRDVSQKLHHPHMTMPDMPLTGLYMTIIKDGELYRAYYRYANPDYEGERYTGKPGPGEKRLFRRACWLFREQRRYELVKPSLGLFKGKGPVYDNAVLDEPPFCHNFSPFLDTNPAAKPNERYKALAGVCRRSDEIPAGLYAFASPDGLNWRREEKSVILYNPELHGSFIAFDSQNLAFWSPEEKRYIAYFRHLKTPHGGNLRTISCRTATCIQCSSGKQVREDAGII